MSNTVASRIASTLEAIANCRATGNAHWLARHQARLAKIIHEKMPSGSGWDCGTQIDYSKSSPDRLVFFGSFHHMDDNGYCGWTEHTITARPSFAHGVTLTISGPNRNDIKEYLHQMFHYALTEDVPQQEYTDLCLRADAGMVQP